MVEGEFEILVGTYEDYVVGYKLECTNLTTKRNGTNNSSNKNHSYNLEQTLAVRLHSGSVKSLAANTSGSLVVSSGVDEKLSLMSFKKRKLLNIIDGAVNCTVFADKNHLICGSEDSSVYIYECKQSSMNLAKTLAGHKGPVTSMSLHPSGKILSTISKDNTMRTWNLIKGRCAYVTNIKQQAHLVSWSKSGHAIMIAADNIIYLYNNTSGLLEHELKLTKRINLVEFINDNIFMVASDWGKLELFDLNKGERMLEFDAHDVRIKGVCCLNQRPLTKKTTNNNKTTTTDGTCDNHKQVEVNFATASSDGSIKVWSMQIKNDSELSKPIELARADTGARLTCMTSVLQESQ